MISTSMIIDICYIASTNGSLSSCFIDCWIVNYLFKLLLVESMKWCTWFKVSSYSSFTSWKLCTNCSVYVGFMRRLQCFGIFQLIVNGINENKQNKSILVAPAVPKVTCTLCIWAVSFTFFSIKQGDWRNLFSQGFIFSGIFNISLSESRALIVGL